MKKIVLLFLFISGNIVAQTSIDIVDGYFYYVDTSNVITLSSKFNVTCTGEFNGDSILLIPNSNTHNVITLGVFGSSGVLSKGGDSTIIRPRPHFGGKTDGSSLNSITNSPIKLFPNPVQDELNIISDTDTITGYTIYNIYGQAIFSENITASKSCNIMTSELKSGSYLLKIENTDEKNSILKFIKK